MNHMGDRTKNNKSKNKTTTTTVTWVVASGAVLAISAGLIPNIAMTAWAAQIQCTTGVQCDGTEGRDNMQGTSGYNPI